MTLLKTLLAQDRAGLTVYSPDAARSGLWGNLDEKIQKSTGFQIAKRQIFEHDVNSVKRFYQELGVPVPPEEDPDEAAARYADMKAEDVRYGHLVVRLLLSGPSLITIWQGANAVSALLALKGKTQPADSEPHTLRGGFWCDNGVCSLVHSSDDNTEICRELSALNLQAWLDAELGELPPIAPKACASDDVAHSGILTLLQVLNRELEVPTEIELPRSGDARQTHSLLARELKNANFRKHQRLIDSFFDGDLVQLTKGLQSLSMTPWERFVIQCSTVNQDTWQA